MPAPLVSLSFKVPADDSGDMGETTLDQSENGPYAGLSGVLDASTEGDDVGIFVEVTGTDGKKSVYEASLVTVPEDGETGAAASDYGYEIYLPREVVPANATLRVIATDDGELLGVKAF